MTPTLAECLARPQNDLAAVRILAATAVLYAHAWITAVPGVETRDFLHVFVFSLDFHGVHAFFILSGMLLTRSLLDRPDALRFTVARLLRYVPGIFVAAMVAALVLGPMTTRLGLADYFSSRLAEFVAAVTTLADVNATLPGVFDDNPRPGILFVPLWTIHYELVFAIALAGLGALGLLRRRWLVGLGLAATLLVAGVWFWNGEEHLALGWPHHLVRFCTTFGIGIAMAVFADKIPVSGRLMAAIAALAIPLAFTHFAALAGMGLIAYGMIWIGFSGGPLFGLLARLGVWSYGFYVWGYLVEQTIVHAAPGVSAWGVLAIAFPVSLFAGWLSWTLIERPSIRRTGALTQAIRRGLGVEASRELAPARADSSVPVGRK